MTTRREPAASSTACDAMGVRVPPRASWPLPAALGPWAAVVGVVLAGGLTSCAHKTGGTRSVASLPSYDDAARQLFDDRIEPAAVGLADSGKAPGVDPVFRARAQQADFVGRVRISTVSSDSAGGEAVYHLSLLPVGSAFAVRGPEPTLDLAVSQRDPSFGVVRALDTAAVGKSLVAFVRRFTTGDQAEQHWHLAPDVPEVEAAVREANTLREVTR